MPTTKHTPVSTNAYRGTATYQFDNGYGASVIPDPHAPRRLFEVAVLDADGDINYTALGPNPIFGFLTSDSVAALLDRIAALDPA